MSEATLRPTPEETLSRLSRMAEEMRAHLERFQLRLPREGPVLPPGTLEGLRQLSGTLLILRKSFEETEVERRDLRALAEIGQVVNSSLDLTTVLNEVIDTIIRITGAERAFLMLRNDQGEMETVVARNWERASLQSGENEISRTIVGRVLSHGEAILTTNAQADPRFGGQDSVIAYNLRSILCVPLKVKGKLTGVIYADNKAREALFSERQRSLLSDFANQAAAALDNARLFASVRRTLDEVTELKNLMEDVFASIASGVITADIEDTITLCNKAAENILGRPGRRLLGGPLSEILPELSQDLERLVTEAKTADKRFIGVEVHPSHPERGTLELSLAVTPVKTAEQQTRGVAIVVDDLTETRKLEALHRLFERMVPPAVIEQLDPDSLELGGRRTILTTLFADIRGFTSLGESTDPETLIAVLNRYLAAAAEAVLYEQGTIDKFLGDAVMAWFNAPIPQPDHTLRAVRAALGIRRAVEELQATLEPPFRLAFGIGIHQGEAVLGLVGTEKRIDYTAIGDSVNTAKRLQENAGPGQILISQSTVETLGNAVVVRKVPAVRAEGKEHPIDVVELVGLA